MLADRYMGYIVNKFQQVLVEGRVWLSGVRSEQLNRSQVGNVKGTEGFLE